MRRAAVWIIAACIPVTLAVNGIYVLLHPWFVRFEYARDGFPPDPYGMGTAERTRLAMVGLHSILPWHREGVGLLREARLAGGEPAFDDHELRHMGDVRRLLGKLLAIHALTVLALVVLAAVKRTRPVARSALVAGAFATLGLFALVGVLLALNAVWFLTGFHTLFFSGSSWRFAETETLRRLYPDRFWSDTSLILALGAAVQAGLLLALLWRPGLRRARAGPA